ncbi:ninjurin-2-like [Bradysia coprophila]|uniref:ninjurin-2-like n=1 Tax=Bradysia coprophila TaxID=38358 RepID=UPI00187DAC0F|nr:ninjurin-2-like [Bradysia coprophila]
MAGHSNSAKIFDELSSGRSVEIIEPDNPKQIGNVPTENTDHLFKGLNANTYASKKSFAQGMLDLALISSNAAQLKYILTAGPDHQFYTLLLSLVLLSLCLQILQAVLCLVLGLIFDLNKVDEQRSANICNNIGVCLVVVIVVINVIITGFNFKSD